MGLLAVVLAPFDLNTLAEWFRWNRQRAAGGLSRESLLLIATAAQYAV